MALPMELQPQAIQDLYTRLKPATTLLAEFFPPRPNQVVGARVTYDVLDYRNALARAVPRGAEAPLREAPTRSTVSFEAPTFKDALRIPREWFDARAAGSMDAPAREQLVAAAVQQLRLNHEKRLEWLRAQWITGGALLKSDGSVPGVAGGDVYLDYASDLKSAPQSVSLGLDSTLVAATVSASWATASTNILKDLNAAREKVEAASGVSPRTVLLNANTMAYINGNTAANASEVAKTEIFRNGFLAQAWGYEFLVYNAKFAIDTYTMNDTAGTEYYIPDNVVVLLSRDNVASGRAMVECSPSDVNAPTGARGAYAWIDQVAVHPHGEVPGIEITAGPMIAIPDSMFIWKSVTTT